MRRWAFVLMLFALVFPLRLANAQEGTPKETSLPPVYRGPQDFGTATFGKAESVLVKAGLTFGYTMTDLITPIYNGARQIARPILEPYRQTMEKLVDYLNPQEVKDSMIPYSTENPNQSYSIFCATGTNEEKYAGEKRVSEGVDDVQISENWRDSQPVMQYGYNTNALWGLTTKECPGGVCDWNRAPMRMGAADPLAFCDTTEQGKAHTALETAVTKLASFGIGPGVFLTMPLNRILGFDRSGNPIFEGSVAQETMRLTEETLHSNSMELGHYGSPDTKDVDQSPYAQTRETGVSGGWTMAFIPQWLRDQKPLSNALVDYDYQVKFFPTTAGIQAPNSIVNDMKVNTQRAACLATPDLHLETTTIGENEETRIPINEDNACNPTQPNRVH